MALACVECLFGLAESDALVGQRAIKLLLPTKSSKVTDQIQGARVWTADRMRRNEQIRELTTLAFHQRCDGHNGDDIG